MKPRFIFLEASSGVSRAVNLNTVSLIDYSVRNDDPNMMDIKFVFFDGTQFSIKLTIDLWKKLEKDL